MFVILYLVRSFGPPHVLVGNDECLDHVWDTHHQRFKNVIVQQKDQRNE